MLSPNKRPYGDSCCSAKTTTCVTKKNSLQNIVSRQPLPSRQRHDSSVDLSKKVVKADMNIRQMGGQFANTADGSVSNGVPNSLAPACVFCLRYPGRWYISYISPWITTTTTIIQRVYTAHGTYFVRDGQSKSTMEILIHIY